MCKVKQKRSGPLEFMLIVQAGIVLYGNGGFKGNAPKKYIALSKRASIQLTKYCNPMFFVPAGT